MSIQDTELDYQAGYTRILLYAEQARARGWRSMLGQGGHSAAWNRGQADGLRTLLREQREKLQS